MENIIKIMPPNISFVVRACVNTCGKDIEEIRIRSGRPLIFIKNGKEHYFDIKGNEIKNIKEAYTTSKEDIQKVLEALCENSVYAYIEDIKRGFITLKNGHRAGICGRTVCEGEEIKNIKEISGINIRIAKEIFGCASQTIKYIANGGSVLSTLIISPPMCGKTTIIRELARCVSDGLSGLYPHNVSIVDERSEISSLYKGIPQFDTGIRTDVLDSCPKTKGLIMMIRSMSPQVVITDEIGGRGDFDALLAVMNAGVKIIATSHGYSLSELESRQEVTQIIKNKIFERYVILSRRNGPGTLEYVCDRDMKPIYTLK